MSAVSFRVDAAGGEIGIHLVLGIAILDLDAVGVGLLRVASSGAAAMAGAPGIGPVPGSRSVGMESSLFPTGR